MSRSVSTIARRHGFFFRWAIAAGLLFVIMLAWSIASPVPSGPDEEAQLIKAAAVAHGQLIGRPDPAAKRSKAVVIVKVPEVVATGRKRGACDYKDIESSAACTGQVTPSGKLVEISTYEGHYPPLYYFLTGLPTVFTSSSSVLHMMRAVSALIVALLIGLAFAVVITWGRSSMLLVGLAVTVTPTVLYLGGVVNPSAMEIAGGILLWAALAVMVFHRSEDPPKALVASAVAGGVALCASRPLSTGFFVLIVASIFLFRPRECLRLLRFRRVQVGSAIALVLAFVAGLFVLFAKSYEVEAFPIKHTMTTFGYVAEVLGRGGRSLRQVIGAFGSPNFSVPEPVLGVWLVAGFGIIALALLFARRRDAWVLLGLVAFLGFILPFVIVYSHIKHDGVVWQGRYSLPLIAGFPIVSGLLIGERYPEQVAALRRRVSAVVLTGLCFGWIASFYWVLRRYTVGLRQNATDAFRHDAHYWPTVVPSKLLFALLVAVTFAFAGWLYLEARGVDRRRSPSGITRTSGITSASSPANT